jgi:hypothetical protein
MRNRLLWIIVGVTACSSSPRAPVTSPTTTRTVQVSGMPGKLTVTSSASASLTEVASPVQDVWKVLPAVFDSLGIKPSLIDPGAHTLGIENQKVRVKLGTTPLSRYLDCGQTQIGPNADEYQVLLTVVTRVQASTAGGSTLGTLVDAVAKPIAFNQEYARCATKGMLEQRIADAVKKQLSR